MKQIVFISGKGGTGKSTVTASLCQLVQNKIMADCDVDAPNLHLIIQGDTLKEADFFGAKEAVIDQDACISCGLCREACRYEAITEDFNVKMMKCEGCGACMLVCPEKAISLVNVKTGKTYIDKTQHGTFSHALLDIGAEGSGRLVTEVKKNMGEYTKYEDRALVDGSPGIGCVVIASITGADAVVVVCEPTKSGKSDLERALGVTRHFGIPAFICINKYDINPEITDDISRYCQSNGYPLIGKIPFEPAIVKALQKLQTPIEAGIENVSAEIGDIWTRLQNELAKLDELN